METTAADDEPTTAAGGSSDGGSSTSTSGVDSSVDTTTGLDLPAPPTDLDEALAIYDEAWNELDADRRLALLELAWADDGHYTDPSVDAPDRAALSAAIGAFHDGFPGAVISFVGSPDVYGQHFRLDWAISGPVELPGMDVGEIDDEFRLVRISGFFGPFPTDTPVPATVTAYVDAWNAADADARDALLAMAVTDDVIYRDPSGEIAGRDALSEYIGQVQMTLGGAPIALMGTPDAYGTVMRYAWVFGDPEAPTLTGMDMVDVAPDGRFSAITGFFDR